MAVSKRLRFEVLRRDNFTCRYCGLRAPDVELRVDHVIPVTLGGSDDPTNLATSCEPCNSGKSATPPDAPLVADVAAAALRWRASIVEARVRLAGDRYLIDDLRTAIEVEWGDWMERDWRIKPPPPDWVLSVEPWSRAGVTAQVVPRLLEPAMLRRVDDRWPYFCGVVRNYINELQDRALDIVDTDPSTWVTAPLP